MKVITGTIRQNRHTPTTPGLHPGNRVRRTLTMTMPR